MLGSDRNCKITGVGLSGRGFTSRDRAGLRSKNTTQSPSQGQIRASNEVRGAVRPVSARSLVLLVWTN
jgi:hypothetical protein